MSSEDKRFIATKSLEKLRITIIELFSEGLYHEVGIREICKRAKVSPHTIYKYFGNKEELLYATIKEDMEALTENLISAASAQDSLPQKVVAFVETFFSFYYQNPAIAKIVFLNIPASYWIDETKFVQRGYHDYIRDLIVQGQEEGLILQVDPQILMEIIMGAVSRLIIKWLIDPEEMEYQKTVNSVLAVIHQSMLVKKA